MVAVYFRDQTCNLQCPQKAPHVLPGIKIAKCCLFLLFGWSRSGRLFSRHCLWLYSCIQVSSDLCSSSLRLLLDPWIAEPCASMFICCSSLLFSLHNDASSVCTPRLTVGEQSSTGDCGRVGVSLAARQLFVKTQFCSRHDRLYSKTMLSA